MRYLSVCSGIEAASVAWHPLGWEPVAFAEVDKFPSRVLAHRFPNTPNWGDMTKFQEWPDAAFDVLVGGTPCQSFSIAGLRQGLNDPRGNLMLTYLAIAGRYRPQWLVWENVPGVLSSNGGRDFGTFLAGLAELGYHAAWRVLDAQYVRVDGFGRAVPQRRRRVFVVGYLGDWRRAAQVLLEPSSLRGDSAPRRQAGQGTAAGASQGTGERSHWDGDFAHPTLNQSAKGSGGVGASNQEIFSQRGAYPVGDVHTARMVAFGEYEDDGTASAMKARDYKDATDLVAHSLRAEGFDASEDGSGRGTPLVPIAFSSKDHGADAMEGVSPTLRAGGHADSHANGGVMPAVAYGIRSDAMREGEAKTPSADAEGRVRLRNPGMGVTEGVAPTVDASKPHAVAFQPRFVRNGRGAPEEIAAPLTTGTDPSANIVAIQERAISENPNAGPGGVGVRQDGAAYTLEARQVPQAVAYSIMPMNSGKDYKARETDVAQPIMAGGPVGGNQGGDYITHQWAVRRLTPEECEALQGFPRSWTDIGDGKGGPTPDGPRYKALGNSMACNVMRWIGRRIEMVEKINMGGA